MAEPRVVGMHAVVERDGVADEVAVEEPLEIRVDGEPLAVTMRTPGHDEELAAGFLHGEGLLAGPPRFHPTLDANAVDVAGPLAREPGTRRFYTTSSCGVCGKGALEEVAVHSPPVPAGPIVARDLLAALPERLEQPEFARTGGLHATGLFDSAGTLVLAREDVGRHNAMDKVIGRSLLDGATPLARPRAVRERAPVLRARAEGRRRRRPDPRRRRRAHLPGDRAGRRPRAHPVWVRPRRPAQRLRPTRAGRRHCLGITYGPHWAPPIEASSFTGAPLMSLSWIVSALPVTDTCP